MYIETATKEQIMANQVTISGHKFEVPEGILAKYELGYSLQTEGEVSAIRQTLVENLRNNFASTVKAAGNGELTDEQVAELQAKFNEYAQTYQFGVRKAGSGAPRAPKDPVEREMQKLARDAVSKAFYAKHGEKIDKDQLADLSTKLLEAKHDEYAKRARTIIRERERAGAEDLASIGL
jgi:hypothetical protein